jgi:hypothetical protein
MSNPSADLCIVCNTDFKKILRCKTGQPSVAVPVAGWTAEMEIRKESGRPLVLRLATAENAVQGAGTITITDANNGEFTLFAPKAATHSLAPGVYRYDMLWRDSLGETARSIWGVMKIIASITGSTA